MPFESKQLEKGDPITYIQASPQNGIFHHFGTVIEYPVKDNKGLAIRIKLHNATESILSHTQSRVINKIKLTQLPSRFLNEIPDKEFL